MNWILLITAVIMACCMYQGYRKGLIRTVFSVGAFIAAIILVAVLAPTTMKILQENTPLHDKIKKPVLEKLQEDSSDGLSIEKLMDIYKVPDTISQTIMQYNMEQSNEISIASVTDGAKEQAADYIASRILKIIAYILTFIIINVTIWVIGMALDLFAKLPVIGGVNKLAGLFLGFIEGVGCIWILFLIISIAGTTQMGQACLHMIQQNAMLTALYESNLLLLFI